MSGSVELRALLQRHVDEGMAPALMVVTAHHGEVRSTAVGTLAYEGPGADVPFGRDTIWRTASMTKPVVSACAMTLVDDGTVDLDEPVDPLLPELADPHVLARPDGPLDETVPAEQPITLRHLLTFTCGIGMVLDESPIAQALRFPRSSSLDEWVGRVAALPLVHQPGDRWLYDTAASLTGALIARATGQSFGQAMRARIFEPLGMRDTGFSVPPDQQHRSSTGYAQHDGRVVDDGPDGLWSAPPKVESGGAGLVSTADDYLAFAAMLLAGGTHGGHRVLSPESVALMTTNHLTPEQRAVSGFRPGYFDEFGWGFGMSVRTEPMPGGQSVGTYGWPGLWGTAWYNDPAEELVAMVLMQRAHMGDQQSPFWQEMWPAVYRSLHD